MSNKSINTNDFLDILKSPYYGMVYLGLANLAYTSEGDKKDIAANLEAALTNVEYMPTLPPLPPQQYPVAPDVTNGKWQLDWGPAIAGDNSNLIYIASYKDGSDTTLFYVVGVRGTDTSSTPEGIVNQIVQDISDFKLNSWAELLDGQLKDFDKPPRVYDHSTDDQKGQVSSGSIDGFLKLANLTPKHSDVVLVDKMNALLSDQIAPIIVTGHSLGGNQTQMVAAYLDWQFGDKTTVIPMPFAPPTPGDKDFANLPVFSNGLFWHNTFDVVPYAYIMMDNNTMFGLDWAKENLWDKFKWPDGNDGPKLPDLMRDAINKLGPDVPKIFSRPPANTLIELNGSIPEPSIIEELLQSMGWLTKELIDKKGGLAQLMWQHFPPCYRMLITEQMQGKVVQYDYKSYSADKKTTAV